MPGILTSETQPAIDQSTLAAMLAARQFDLLSPPPKARPILQLGNATIATPGNLTVIAAQAKAGKSALIGAIIAASTGLPGDTLGITSSNPCQFGVVHFDSEQSPYDHHQLIVSAFRRVQLNVQPCWLYSYHVADLSPKERFAALELSLLNAKATHSAVHLALVDGAADLILDPNDTTESFAAVDRLHRLAVQYDTNIVCVIHFNPGTENNKTRGHLGSQLERKSETNLALEKDADGVTVVYTKLGRHCHIDKAQGQRFRWDDEAGMHISCESLREEKSRETSLVDADTLDTVFSEKSTLRYSEIIAGVSKFRECTKRTAERHFARLRRDGTIKEAGLKGFYAWSK